MYVYKIHDGLSFTIDQFRTRNTMNDTILQLNNRQFDYYSYDIGPKCLYTTFHLHSRFKFHFHDNNTDDIYTRTTFN